MKREKYSLPDKLLYMENGAAPAGIWIVFYFYVFVFKLIANIICYLLC